VKVVKFLKRFLKKRKYLVVYMYETKNGSALGSCTIENANFPKNILAATDKLIEEIEELQGIKIEVLNIINFIKIR